MQVQPGKERDGSGVGYLSIEQWRQSVPACQSIKQVVRSGVRLGELIGIPFGKFVQCALPEDLVFLLTDRAEPAFIQSKGIGAPEQGATSRPLPLPIFLLKVPRLELGTTPAKMLRSNTPQAGERRHPQTRKDLWRNFVEEPGPAPKRAGDCIIEF